MNKKKTGHHIIPLGVSLFFGSLFSSCWKKKINQKTKTIWNEIVFRFWFFFLLVSPFICSQEDDYINSQHEHEHDYTNRIRHEDKSINDRWRWRWRCYLWSTHCSQGSLGLVYSLGFLPVLCRVKKKQKNFLFFFFFANYSQLRTYIIFEKKISSAGTTYHALFFHILNWRAASRKKIKLHFFLKYDFPFKSK